MIASLKYKQQIFILKIEEFPILGYFFDWNLS